MTVSLLKVTLSRSVAAHCSFSDNPIVFPYMPRKQLTRGTITRIVALKDPGHQTKVIAEETGVSKR